VFDAIPGTKRNYIARRPVLVIPFCENEELVYAWEELNKFVEEENYIFLKTIYPSRKYTKKYL